MCLPNGAKHGKTLYFVLWQETTLVSSGVLLNLRFMNEVWLGAPFLDCTIGVKLRYLTGSLFGRAVTQESLNINQEKLFIHHHFFTTEPQSAHPEFGCEGWALGWLTLRGGRDQPESPNQRFLRWPY